MRLLNKTPKFDKVSKALLDFVAYASLSTLIQLTILISYKDFISPTYSYFGLTYSPISISMLVASIAIGSIPIFFLPKHIDKIGGLVLWIIYITNILPFTIISFALKKYENFPLLATATIIPFIVTCVLYNSLRGSSSLHIREIPPISRTLSNIVIATATITIGVVLILKFNPSFTLDLSGVYTRRYEMREKAIDGSFFSYLIAIYSSFIIPICLCASFRNRLNILLVSLASGASILVFSLQGTKASLLTLCSMLFVYYGVRKKLLSPIFLLGATLSALAAAYIIDVYFGLGILTNSITRRIFCIPVFLTNAYFDYFSNENFITFLDFPFIADIIDERKSTSASFLIGEVHFGEKGLNANVGAVPYGYAELGVAGSWIFSVLCLTYIILIEKFSNNISQLAILPLAVPIALKFTEQSFQTSLITGGLFLILATTLFYRERVDSSRNPTSQALEQVY